MIHNLSLCFICTSKKSIFFSLFCMHWIQLFYVSSCSQTAWLSYWLCSCWKPSSSVLSQLSTLRLCFIIPRSRQASLWRVQCRLRGVRPWFSAKDALQGLRVSAFLSRDSLTRLSAGCNWSPNEIPATAWIKEQVETRHRLALCFCQTP